MSRMAHTSARRHRAVWDRPAHGTRLLPSSFPNTVSLRIPLPGDGKSTDYWRHALSMGPRRFNAPLTGGACVAAMRIAGEFPEPHNAGLTFRATVPLRDSTTRHHPRVPLGSPRRRVDMPSLSTVERCCRTDRPHTETPSNLERLLRHVWGLRGIAADVEHPLRRTTGVGAGVVVFLHNSHGPFIAFPSPCSVIPAAEPESIPSPVGTVRESPNSPLTPSPNPRKDPTPHR